MNTGKTKQWFEEHAWPSQPVFVPNPAAVTSGSSSSSNGRNDDDDDEGVVLDLVADGRKRKSYLLALDGKTMREVARAEIPVLLPYTSHGYFDVAMGGRANQTMVPGLKNGWVMGR